MILVMEWFYFTLEVKIKQLKLLFTPPPNYLLVTFKLCEKELFHRDQNRGMFVIF